MGRIKYILTTIVMLLSFIKIPFVSNVASAVTNEEITTSPRCANLRIIFARGSGGERWTSGHYLSFKAEIEKYLIGTGIDYEFIDLDYPAIALNLEVIIGAFLSGGEGYKFGESMFEGYYELLDVVNDCPDSKYVLGGYSQGAMIVDRAMHVIDPEKIIYAASFGDPKIYLPEGKGLMPAACMGMGLSEYRMYVPDCRTYIGALGTYTPYQPDDYSGKFGVWCNSFDILCSSYVSIKSHTSYAEDGIYEKAAEVIFEKIAEEFEIEIRKEPTREVAILVVNQSGGGGAPIPEARELALKTLALNGRVSIYRHDIGSLGHHELKRLCDFEACDSEGGVTVSTSGSNGFSLSMPNQYGSITNSIMRILNEGKWGEEAERVLIVLSNQADGIKEEIRFADTGAGIDGVRVIYGEAEDYVEVGELLFGAGESEISLMSLELGGPEIFDGGGEIPELTVLGTEIIDGATVKIRFLSSGGRAMVALNDGILGIVEGEEVVIYDLDSAVENRIILVPLSDTRRGILKEVVLPAMGYGESEIVVPLAPDTGKV